MSLNDQDKIKIAREYFVRVDQGRPDILELFHEDAEIYFPKFGFGFGRQSPTLERRAAELEQLGPREGLELEGARDELLLVPRWSRQRFLIIPNKRCSDKREPHPSLNRVIGGFSNLFDEAKLGLEFWEIDIPRVFALHAGDQEFAAPVK